MVMIAPAKTRKTRVIIGYSSLSQKLNIRSIFVLARHIQPPQRRNPHLRRTLSRARPARLRPRPPHLPPNLSRPRHGLPVACRVYEIPLMETALPDSGGSCHESL